MVKSEKKKRKGGRKEDTNVRKQKKSEGKQGRK